MSDSKHPPLHSGRGRGEVGSKTPPQPSPGKGGSQGRGEVYLVGAGPGDPGLLTVRAAELLSRADVVVNDRLASPRLLELARPDAEIVYAGKLPQHHHLTQDEIIDVIIDRAKKGNMVVRLKGGDPFVFGRGGEEAEALAEAGIDFEIVPGITSAIAVPAYAGIPVTSRTYATSFAVITGHEAAGKPGPSTGSGCGSVRWDKLAVGPDTLVLLMGVENLPGIVEALVANGRPAETPVAVIRWGTRPEQKTVTGTLADIVRRCEEEQMTSPSVTVIGEVVRLRENISWFEKKPLFGRRVIVTRAAHQASALTRRLVDLGAAVEELPVIKFVPPSDTSAIDSAISRLDSFDWIIFTSANGVEWFVRRLEETGSDLRAMGNAKLAAIGPKTAAALRDLRLRVDYVPSEYVAEAVVNEFPEDVSGKRILIPRAKEAREELPEGLRARAAVVEVATAYETVTDTDSADALRERLREGDIDVVTFTSASTVRGFFELAGDAKLPDHTLVACIGPITAACARKHGLDPKVIADDYTIDGLVTALSGHLGLRC